MLPIMVCDINADSLLSCSLVRIHISLVPKWAPPGHEAKFTCAYDYTGWGWLAPGIIYYGHYNYIIKIMNF